MRRPGSTDAQQSHIRRFAGDREVSAVNAPRDPPSPRRMQRVRRRAGVDRPKVTSARDMQPSAAPSDRVKNESWPGALRGKMIRSATSKPITVGVRGQESAALAFAVAEARRVDAPLRLVHAIDLGRSNPDNLRAVRRATAFEDVVRQILNVAGETVRLLADGEIEVEKVIRNDRVVHALVEESEVSRLLVLERRALSRMVPMFTGATVSAIAAKAYCPVVSVPEAWQSGSDGREVLVGLDDSGELYEALWTAFAEANKREVPVRVLHAWQLDSVYDDVGPSSDLKEQWRRSSVPLLERATARCGSLYPEVKSVIEMRYADPVASLVHESERAGLLVLGRRSRRGPLHIGSLARATIRASACPVLVVPVPDVNGDWELAADDVSPQT